MSCIIELPAIVNELANELHSPNMTSGMDLLVRATTQGKGSSKTSSHGDNGIQFDKDEYIRMKYALDKATITIRQLESRIAFLMKDRCGKSSLQKSYDLSPLELTIVSTVNQIIQEQL